MEINSLKGRLNKCLMWTWFLFNHSTGFALLSVWSAPLSQAGWGCWVSSRTIKPAARQEESRTKQPTVPLPFIWGWDKLALQKIPEKGFTEGSRYNELFRGKAWKQSGNVSQHSRGTHTDKVKALPRLRCLTMALSGSAFAQEVFVARLPSSLHF